MTTGTHRSLLTWRVAAEAAITAIIATALALLVFGPIWSELTYPLAAGDMYPTYVNAVLFGGLAYPTTTQFGFPFGLDLDHTPSLDLTQNAVAHILNGLLGSPFAGINLVLFASFPVVAVLACLLLRVLDVRGPLAVCLAVAYAMIPFHFGRGLGHTYLATMYSAVTALTIAVVIGLGLVPRIARHPTRSRRIVGWAALGVLVLVTAWSGLYYAVFAVILGGAAVVWRFARRDTVRDLALAVTPVVGVVGLVLVGYLPAVVTTITDPLSQPIAHRSASESVDLAGNLAMALTPVPVDLPSVLARYAAAVLNLYGTAPQTEPNTFPNFGTWVTTGCAVVFLVGLAIWARRRRLRGSPLPLLTYLVVVTVAFFVPSGLNLLLAQTFTTQIRAWNRLLPIVLLLFVCGAAVVLSRTRLGRCSLLSAVAATLVIAVVAGTQVLPFRQAYATGAAEGRVNVEAARQYAAAVNAAIPGDCGVLQLPYAVYPEQGSIEHLTDYEHFLQALVNPGKEFSYGTVRGTTGATELAGLGNRLSPAAVDRLRAIGFCAVHVDRRGFTDRAWTWVAAGLREQFGEPIATGLDGTWVAYDLRAAS